MSFLEIVGGIAMTFMAIGSFFGAGWLIDWFTSLAASERRTAERLDVAMNDITKIHCRLVDIEVALKKAGWKQKSSD